MVCVGHERHCGCDVGAVCDHCTYQCPEYAAEANRYGRWWRQPGEVMPIPNEEDR